MHKEKTTTDLLSDIRKSPSINDFLTQNATALHYPTVAQYLNEIITPKKIPVSFLAEQAGYSRDYLYKVLDNKKDKPSRSFLLCTALALKLSYDETVLLLKYAQVAPLYARSPADSIIIHALQHGMSLAETNEQLDIHHLPPLGNNRAG